MWISVGIFSRLSGTQCAFSSLFQEPPKSAKSTTKSSGGSSGKDGGAENSEEVRT